MKKEDEGLSDEGPAFGGDRVWAAQPGCRYRCGACKLCCAMVAAPPRPPRDELVSPCDSNVSPPASADSPCPSSPSFSEELPEDAELPLEEGVPGSLSASPCPSSSGPSPFASARASPPPAAPPSEEHAAGPAEVLSRLPVPLRDQVLAQLPEEDRAELEADVEAELAGSEVQVVSVDGLRVDPHRRLVRGLLGR